MKMHRIVVAALVLAVWSSLAWVFHLHLRQRILVRSCQQNCEAWARFAGQMQAHADYGNGVRRVYELGSSEARFTGRKDGICEIWCWPHPPDDSPYDWAGGEAFVAAYNEGMKKWIASPEDYDPHGLAAKSKKGCEPPVPPDAKGRGALGAGEP